MWGLCKRSTKLDAKKIEFNTLADWCFKKKRSKINYQVIPFFACTTATLRAKKKDCNKNIIKAIKFQQPNGPRSLLPSFVRTQRVQRVIRFFFLLKTCRFSGPQLIQNLQNYWHPFYQHSFARKSLSPPPASFKNLSTSCLVILLLFCVRPGVKNLIKQN